MIKFKIKVKRRNLHFKFGNFEKTGYKKMYKIFVRVDKDVTPCHHFSLDLGELCTIQVKQY